MKKSGVWRPTSNKYLVGILGQIGAIVLIVLVAVEAVFLSDIIISRVLPKLLAHGVDGFSILQVTLYAIPGGIFIALPTAILIGVYFVFLRRREDQEFIVSAGFGYDLKPLIAIGFFVGVFGAIASLATSGFVEPHARYQMKTTIAAAAHQAIRDGELESGRVYSVGDITLYAAFGRFNDVAANVFIHQKLPDDVIRVIFAGKIQNPKMTEGGRIGLVFSDAHLYEFANLDPAQRLTQQLNKEADHCIDCNNGTFASPLKHRLFNKLYSELPPAEFPKLRNRSGPSETTITEILALSKFDAKMVHAFGERVLRAALCILAPFLAMVAVAMTMRASLLFALPGAAGIVLALSFFSSSLIKQLSHFGHFVTAVSILVVFIGMISICIWIIYKMREYLTRSIAITF